MMKMRNITRRGKETFRILLSNIQVDLTAENMNSIFEKYHKILFDAYNLSFPLVLKTIKSKETAPWMSCRLKDCIKKKSKLYRMYLRGTVTREEYTQYKNRLTSVVRRVKALYYARLFWEYASNSKMVWNTINEILDRKTHTALKEVTFNGVILKGEDLMNHVNDYFVNIAATICAAVPETVVVRADL